MPTSEVVAVLCAHRQKGGAATVEESVTTSNTSRRRSGALIAAAAAGVLGVGLAAGPAFAHTPKWSASCTEVSVDLTAYGAKSENTVTITADGKDLLPTETFQNEFHKKIELPKHDKELTLRLVVKASDGEKFSVDDTKTAPVCEDDDNPPPSATPSNTPSSSAPTPSEAPSTTPPTTDAPVPSSAPTPNAGSDDLAETGSSSSTPLIAGAAAVVIVAGGGIMWAARKRRNTA